MTRFVTIWRLLDARYVARFKFTITWYVSPPLLNHRPTAVGKQPQKYFLVITTFSTCYSNTCFCRPRWLAPVQPSGLLVFVANPSLERSSLPPFPLLGVYSCVFEVSFFFFLVYSAFFCPTSPQGTFYYKYSLLIVGRKGSVRRVTLKALIKDLYSHET